MQLATHELRD
ncbi:Protein of unknown function [Bacillus cereus]|nr:Protein of unknown function [Bacillus cereus]